MRLFYLQTYQTHFQTYFSCIRYILHLPQDILNITTHLTTQYHYLSMARPQCYSTPTTINKIRHYPHVHDVAMETPCRKLFIGISVGIFTQIQNYAHALNVWSFLYKLVDFYSENYITIIQTLQNLNTCSIIFTTFFSSSILKNSIDKHILI